MAVVAVAIALAAAGLGVFLALSAANREPIPIEGEPATCESPERLRGGADLVALAERVAAEVLGVEATSTGVTGSVVGTNTGSVAVRVAGGAEVVFQVVERPPCVRSASSPELELTADGLVSEVAGTADVRLHDAELRYAETVRAGVRLEAGEPVELDLPPGAWAQATVRSADGRMLHALVPT